MTAIVKTNQPILKDRLKLMHSVASFWDKISNGWNNIWGPHIHHGYYDELHYSPLQAQEKLIEKLCELMNILPNSKILDIGCGMGGSAFYLAEKYAANVEGITLSSKQVSIAKKIADEKNLRDVNFRLEDALSLASFKDETFDMAWSLESCEQFFDKQQFIKQVHRKLKTNGKLMLATWCSDQEEYSEKEAKQYHKLCHAFDVPYMPTINHYQELLKARGFSIEKTLDWSDQVKRSWDIGLNILGAYSVFKLIKTGGFRGLRFARQVGLMQSAFKEGRVKYAVFVAKK